MTFSRCAASSSSSLPRLKDCAIYSSWGSTAVCAVRYVSEILSVTKSRMSSEISAVSPTEVTWVIRMRGIASGANVPFGNVSLS